MKTSELTGAALDWAVAKCEGHEVYLRRDFIKSRHEYLKSNANIGFHLEYQSNDPIIGDIESGATMPLPHYSTNWAQGGPIIERERIRIRFEVECYWYFTTPTDIWLANYEGVGEWLGPTPLIAAMRCFVASRLGDEVDVPEELTMLGEKR